jgi:hypothetical protein
MDRTLLVNTSFAEHTAWPLRPLVADWSQHLGWFRFCFDDDRWHWSPEVERMHGYRPGSTAPSTLKVLSHVHLADYRRVAATLQDARETHQPFCSQHRIQDTAHRVHRIAMIAAPIADAQGTTVGMQGFWLEMPAASARDDQRRNEIRAATRC